MELREFLEIFIKYKKGFWGVISLFVFGGGFYFVFQPETYKSSLTLNVSRGSESVVKEYAYDDFYRLQADERFADTVVRWLDSPRVVQNILADCDFVKSNSFPTFSDRQLRNMFSAKRMSSQVVDITFVTQEIFQATELSDSIKKNINQETEKLNQKQNQSRWFIVLGDEPVVTSNQKSLPFLLALTGLVGLFVSFMITMFRHYWNE